MDHVVTRRTVAGALGAGLVMPPLALRANEADKLYRIRTITAGVSLSSLRDLDEVESAIGFLKTAQGIYEAAGHEVQTVRISTESLPAYAPDWRSDGVFERLQALDALCSEHSVSLSIGQLVPGDVFDDEFASWAVRLIQNTGRISFTVNIASDAIGVHEASARTAAATIERLGAETEGGEGNFRFAATAYCPPGTPFFPAAYHEGKRAFAIGLETPRLLSAVIDEASGFKDAKRALSEGMNKVLKPLQKIANRIAKDERRQYLGIDASPAPGPDASIGETIEKMTGAPFGEAQTLSACAALTDVLKTLDVKLCGYSGLMLPVLEDTVLARRVVEKRYGISELLLYSSVCGTGLDTVPLPGNTSPGMIAKIINDVGSLAHKYRKPLSARLFPVSGKQVGDAVTFDNPFLTDAIVMAAD